MNRLIGAKILGITQGSTSDSLLGIITDKGIMEFKHEQDCCESVYLEDGIEDLKKMVGEVILLAEYINSDDEPPKTDVAYYDEDDSYTWTFYKISTRNHDCTLRFYGTSNGYYSESVDIKFIENK